MELTPTLARSVMLLIEIVFFYIHKATTPQTDVLLLQQYSIFSMRTREREEIRQRARGRETGKVYMMSTLTLISIYKSESKI